MTGVVLDAAPHDRQLVGEHPLILRRGERSSGRTAVRLDG
jgi:hypothetical protein